MGRSIRTLLSTLVVVAALGVTGLAAAGAWRMPTPDALRHAARMVFVPAGLVYCLTVIAICSRRQAARAER